jgi:pyruvate, water dikinase
LRRLVVGEAARPGVTHAAVAERAQQLVRAAEPPSRLRDAIAGAYAKLGDSEPAVAVRSSACAEDGQVASFAGQQETYLHVRGAERVIERMRECWASFFSERALFYRAQKGSLEDLEMAVVVQRMVDADVSGVLFTVDPVRRRHDRMVVEAVFGLGEAVVSGEVTPDHYIIKRDGSIWRQKLNVQPYAIVSAPGGGTRRRELTEEEGAVATLDDEQLRALAVIGEGLHQRTGQAQDIEWAVHDGKLYVLQARPVTA